MRRKLDVLIDLHADEGRPKCDRDQKPKLKPLLVSVLEAANAFTMDTEEQIRTKVLIAVSGTFSTSPGNAKCSGFANRRMTYAQMTRKNMTSEREEIHIPSFLV